jgi:hypothetical protein
MKKEKKDQIIRRISEQSMLKLTPMALGTLPISTNLKPRISFWANTGCAFSTKPKPDPNYDFSNFRVFVFCDIAKGNSCKSPEYSDAKFRVL